MFYIHPCFEKYIQRLASLSPQCYIINYFLFFVLKIKKMKKNVNIFNRKVIDYSHLPQRKMEKLLFINSAFIPTVF